MLSERVKDTFSKLDEKGAMNLMTRPVAMNGNLHNVLFVPEEQIYWTAHASCQGHEPAANQERRSLSISAKAAFAFMSAVSSPVTWYARDAATESHIGWSLHVLVPEP